MDNSTKQLKHFKDATELVTSKMVAVKCQTKALVQRLKGIVTVIKFVSISNHCFCSALQLNQVFSGRTFCFMFFCNTYILLDFLLCSIAEYFYELCRILASP